MDRLLLNLTPRILISVTRLMLGWGGGIMMGVEPLLYNIISVLLAGFSLRLLLFAHSPM